MNPENRSQERPGGNRVSWLELAVLAGLVTPLTIAAGLIYPIWDDGRLLFLINESGPVAIWTTFGDRPLVADFYKFLLDHHAFLPVGLLFHWITWFSMGLVTIYLWRLLFPAYSRFALLPALLTVAPVLSKCQLVILTIVFVVLIGPLLIFLAVFMLLSEQPSLWRKILVYAVALAFIAFAILISQYSVPTAIAAFVLLAARGLVARPGRRRQSLLLAGLTAVSALGSYAVFSWLAEPAISAPYRPGYAFQSLSEKIIVVPFRLLSGIWKGVVGGVLESLGTVALNNKPALLSFVCGIICSVIVALVIYKKVGTGSAAVSSSWFSVLTLLTATAFALLPVLLMGRTLEVRWDSRFWLPILPILSSLTVFILLCLVRQRLWLMVPILCGFLAGYWTSFEIVSGWRNRGEKTFKTMELNLNRDSVDTIVRGGLAQRVTPEKQTSQDWERGRHRPH
jgi:hypothetical protein